MPLRGFRRLEHQTRGDAIIAELLSSFLGTDVHQHIGQSARLRAFADDAGDRNPGGGPVIGQAKREAGVLAEFGPETRQTGDSARLWRTKVRGTYCLAASKVRL